MEDNGQSRDELLKIVDNLEQKIKEKDDLIENLLRRAETDPKTGLKNYHFLREALPVQLHGSYREKEPLALIMIDIDNFKDINDKYGHDRGDEVLISVANVLKDILRDNDITTRYSESADEFIVVLPKTDESGAIKVCQKIQKSITGVSVSIGISTYNPKEEPEDRRGKDIYFDSDELAKSLIKKADTILMQKSKKKKGTICTEKDIQ